MKYLVSGASLGALAIATAAPVAAQDVAPAAEQRQGGVNVIIVTAQRQNQSLQEVPIAVSAFDSEALEAQQIENASDLQLTLPNVSFTKSNFTETDIGDSIAVPHTSPSPWAACVSPIENSAPFTFTGR